MARPELKYKLVIGYIHSNQDTPLAVWEICQKTGVSPSSVIRVLKRLQAIKLMLRASQAFAGRVWRTSSRWPSTLDEAIDQYELSRVLDIG